MFKSYLRLKFLLILVLVHSGCVRNYTLLDNQDYLIEHFKKSNYKIFYDKRHIPKDLLLAIRKKFNTKFKMANPNDLYNQTDMPAKGVPNKKLIFLGVENTESGFIFFEKGGIYPQQICFLYKLNGDNFDIISVVPRINVNSYEDLVKAINYGKFSVSPT